ncbi:MAG: sigma-70 family RNA polymerase sigma factor [Cyclobacteriaceae bacterium]
MSKDNTLRLVEDNNRLLTEISFQEKNQLDTLSDTRIWELFQKGHEIAFIHIYKQNFNDLFSFGSQFSKNEALVEDAIQDMFVELREKRRNNVIKSSIRNYLFTCLRRRILLYKNKFDRNTEPFDSSIFQSFEIGLSAEQRIIEGQIKEEQQKKLEVALKQLTDRQREAIYYLYHEGMSYDEIKDLMNFSNIRSTRNLIYRALNTIKSSILSLLLSLFLYS